MGSIVSMPSVLTGSGGQRVCGGVAGFVGVVGGLVWGYGIWGYGKGGGVWRWGRVSGLRVSFFFCFGGGVLLHVSTSFTNSLCILFVGWVTAI